MKPNFQTKPDQLKRQQEILKALGFYNGPIDGVWAQKSILAMRMFEQDQSFKPGIPNHGMPFSDTGPFPAGISKDPACRRGDDILLYHPLIHVTKTVVEEKKVQPKVEKTVAQETVAQ